MTGSRTPSSPQLTPSVVPSSGEAAWLDPAVSDVVSPGRSRELSVQELQELEEFVGSDSDADIIALALAKAQELLLAHEYLRLRRDPTFGIYIEEAIQLAQEEAMQLAQSIVMEGGGAAGEDGGSGADGAGSGFEGRAGDKGAGDVGSGTGGAGSLWFFGDWSEDEDRRKLEKMYQQRTQVDPNMNSNKPAPGILARALGLARKKGDRKAAWKIAQAMRREAREVKAKKLRVEEAERRLEQREREAQDALAAAEEALARMGNKEASAEDIIKEIKERELEEGVKILAARQGLEALFARQASDPAATAAMLESVSRARKAAAAAAEAAAGAARLAATRAKEA